MDIITVVSAVRMAARVARGALPAVKRLRQAASAAGRVCAAVSRDARVRAAGRALRRAVFVVLAEPVLRLFKRIRGHRRSLRTASAVAAAVNAVGGTYFLCGAVVFVGCAYLLCLLPLTLWRWVAGECFFSFGALYLTAAGVELLCDAWQRRCHLVAAANGF
jgi:hypothetical protein